MAKFNPSLSAFANEVSVPPAATRQADMELVTL